MRRVAAVWLTPEIVASLRPGLIWSDGGSIPADARLVFMAPDPDRGAIACHFEHPTFQPNAEGAPVRFYKGPRLRQVTLAEAHDLAGAELLDLCGGGEAGSDPGDSSLLRWLVSEMKCRSEHGASSNGHLEALLQILRNKTDGRLG